MAIKITKQPNGQYKARVWSKTKNAFGKRETTQKSNINSLAVAKRWAENTEMELSAFELRYYDITFGELNTRFLNTKTSADKLSPSYLNIINYVSPSILKYFEKTPITRMNTPAVQEYINIIQKRENQINGKRLKKGTIQQHLSHIKSVINWGVSQDLVEYNRIRKIELKDDEEPFEATILDADIFGKVLSYIKKYVYNIYIPVLISVLFGPRRGESLGLKTDVIDFENEYFEIKNNIIQIKGVVIERQKLKTKGSKRFNSLSDFFIDEITEHLEMNKYLPENIKDYVSSNVFMGLPSPDYVSKTFHKTMKKVFNIDMRLYDLRHCCNQYMYEGGVDTFTRSSKLGHSYSDNQRTNTNERVYLRQSHLKSKEASNIVANQILKGFKV